MGLKLTRHGKMNSTDRIITSASVKRVMDKTPDHMRVAVLAGMERAARKAGEISVLAAIRYYREDQQALLDKILAGRAESL